MGAPKSRAWKIQRAACTRLALCWPGGSPLRAAGGQPDWNVRPDQTCLLQSNQKTNKSRQGLDGVHLVLAGGEEHHGELGLLFGCRGAGTPRGGRGHRNGSGGGGDAELVFHVLDELRELEDGHASDCVEDFLLGDGHGVCSWFRSLIGSWRIKPGPFPSGRALRRGCGRSF